MAVFLNKGAAFTSDRSLGAVDISTQVAANQGLAFWSWVHAFMCTLCFTSLQSKLFSSLGRTVNMP